MAEFIPPQKTVRHFELPLWEYFLRPELENLADLAREGAVGLIRRFEGEARDRTGRWWRFAWTPRAGLALSRISPPGRNDAGRVAFDGAIGWEARNHLENLTLFHARGHYLKPISDRRYWRKPLRGA
jgi:hypothetical protein